MKLKIEIDAEEYLMLHSAMKCLYNNEEAPGVGLRKFAGDWLRETDRTVVFREKLQDAFAASGLRIEKTSYPEETRASFVTETPARMASIPQGKLTRNAARCLECKTVVESKHVHDWVQCPCGAMFVDGGLEYVRRGGKDPDRIEDLSEYTK